MKIGAAEIVFYTVLAVFAAFEFYILGASILREAYHRGYIAACEDINRDRR